MLSSLILKKQGNRKAESDEESQQMKNLDEQH